eukprot:1508036-Amphidinium_carterae.1
MESCHSPRNGAKQAGQATWSASTRKSMRCLTTYRGVDATQTWERHGVAAGVWPLLGSWRKDDASRRHEPRHAWAPSGLLAEGRRLETA